MISLIVAETQDPGLKISSENEKFKPRMRFLSKIGHCEGHPHTEGTFAGTLVNVGDVRRNSGECQGHHQPNTGSGCPPKGKIPKNRGKLQNSPPLPHPRKCPFFAFLRYFFGNFSLFWGARGICDFCVFFGIFPPRGLPGPVKGGWGGSHEYGVVGLPKFAKVRMKAHAYVWYALEPARRMFISLRFFEAENGLQKLFSFIEVILKLL